MTDKTPYSAEEQEEFRPLVQAKLDEARSDLKLLKDALDHDRDNADGGSQSEGENPLTLVETRQLMVRQEKFIQHLEDALKRIDNRSYGMCRVTGKRISKERLRLVPHAWLSIEAKQDIAKGAQS